MYELIILSLLMRFPLHGYLIVQIANDIIGPWAKISNGTLYPLLAKLEQNGLIERVKDAQGATKIDQASRTFTLTAAGRTRFHQLMLDTSSNIGDYQRLFRLKVPYMDLIEPEERLYLLNHYVNYCQACILHMKTQAEELVHELTGSRGRNPFHRDLILEVMKHHSHLWETEVAWVHQLRDKVIAPGEL